MKERKFYAGWRGKGGLGREGGRDVGMQAGWCRLEMGRGGVGNAAEHNANQPMKMAKIVS